LGLIRDVRSMVIGLNPIAAVNHCRVCQLLQQSIHVD